LPCFTEAQANPQSSFPLFKNGQAVGTAVVIKGGYALTAEHVVSQKDSRPDRIGIGFDTVSVVTSAVLNNTDEAVLLKIGGVHPFSKIGTVFPQVGDAVTTVGYPSGKRTALRGHVTRVSSTFRGNVTSGLTAAFSIETDILTHGGHSGGPLWAASGELIGLCSNTAIQNKKRVLPSQWIGLQSILVATSSIVPTQRFQRKPHVLYFGFDGCPGCAAVERDMKAGLLDDIDIEYVDVGTIEGKARWDALNAAIERANPTYVNQNAFPAFHREGEATIVFGYGLSNGSPRILKWLLETIRLPLTLTEGILGLIYPKSSGPVLAPAPLEEPPLLDPPPAPIATPSPKDPPKDPKIEPKGEPDPPDLPVPAPDPEEEDSPLLVMLLAAGAALVEMFAGKKVKS
jgi:hypothetical protein